MSNLPDPPKEYDHRYMTDLIRALEQALSKMNPHGQNTYSISNFDTTRVVDLSTDDQTTINSFVITAINDLYRRGFLS